jgi:hypothetical protein
MSDHAEYGCCDICQEFDCDTDHDEEECRDDDWMFDGSGMVGDD